MNILSDIRFGLRMLAKSPGFTLAAVVAIALGIGVNSMMFTIYNAALFKTLPFENPRQIVHIHSRNLLDGWEGHGFFDWSASGRGENSFRNFLRERSDTKFHRPKFLTNGIQNQAQSLECKNP